MKINRHDGFTLIEVLIVVAIFAIVLGLGIPNLRHYFDNNNLKSAARSVQGDFMEMKAKAAAENRVHRITFGTGTYTTSRCTAQTYSTCPGGFTNLEIKNPSVFGSGISITSNTFGGYAQFDTRGTVTPGSVTLTNNRGSTAVIITTIAGKVYVQYTLQ